MLGTNKEQYNKWHLALKKSEFILSKKHNCYEELHQHIEQFSLLLRIILF